jgi:hypothetical protein
MLGLGSAMSQQPQVPPADGIQDDTHALSDSVRLLLVQEMASFKKETGCDAWLFAGTFLESGQTLKNQARELRRTWSGEADAVLLAYDRATDTQSVSFSPEVWRRYPAAGLVQIIQKGGLLMADKSKSPELRLRESMRGLLRGLSHLERARLKTEQSFTRDHRRLAQAFGLSLLVGAVMLSLLGALARRRDVYAAWQTHFPLFEVSARLGAACGGGVIVAWTDEKQA